MFDIEKKKSELTEVFNQTTEKIKSIDEAQSKLATDRQALVEQLLQVKGAYEQLLEISEDGEVKEEVKAPNKKGK